MAPQDKGRHIDASIGAGASSVSHDLDTDKRRAEAQRSQMELERINSMQYVSAIQLSIWDNIFGPRVEDAWIVRDLSDEAQKYIARHTLAGEITPTDPNMPSKFHVFPELGLIVTALVFSARHQQTVARYSLSIVVSRKHLSRYLPLHELIEDRLFHISSQLMALLNQGDSDLASGAKARGKSKMRTTPGRKGAKTMEQFHSLLPGFTMKLDALFQSMLPAPNFASTFFHTCEYNRAFIELAVTSHLQTHGCTVVTGRDIPSVNAFIDSLSLFLSPEERMRSSYARPDRKEYVPDLYLQGFVNAQIEDEEFIQSRLPTTLVDLERDTVSQTRLYHEYTLLRTGYLKADVQKLVDLSSVPELWSEHDQLFRSLHSSSDTAEHAAHAAQLVSSFVDVVFKLPLVIREGYVADMMRILTRRAVVLVKYMETEQTGGTTLEASTLKRLRTDLGLSSDADYSLLLAVSEKISPGCYLALAGDPLHMEERFVQLFESF